MRIHAKQSKQPRSFGRRSRIYRAEWPLAAPFFPERNDVASGGCATTAHADVQTNAAPLIPNLRCRRCLHVFNHLQIDSGSDARGFVLHQTAQETKLKEGLRKELQTNAKSPTRMPTAASRNAWKRAALQVTRGFHVGFRGSWSCGIPKAKRQVAMHSTLPLATAPMALCRLTDQHLVRPACHTAPRRNSLSEPSLRVKPASATGLFEARCLFPPPRARQTQGEARRCRSWRAALST